MYTSRSRLVTVLSLVCFYAISLSLTPANGQGDHEAAMKDIIFLPGFGVPKWFITHKCDTEPITYLDRYPVKNPHALLNDEQKRRLLKLFIATGNAALGCETHGQGVVSDYLDSDCPIFVLLETQYPDARDYLMEQKTVVSVGNLTDFCVAKLKVLPPHLPKGRRVR